MVETAHSPQNSETLKLEANSEGHGIKYTGLKPERICAKSRSPRICSKES